jgi:crotonobetainyl-CoA:carnitine CoA-transferase CaiB-like acyl-CoA transferase
MLDVMAGSVANQGMNYLLSGNVPRRGGNRHPNIQPQDVFACRDGQLVLVVGNDGQFRKFCAVIERLDLADDPRFVRNGDRVRNQQILLALVEEALAARDAADWAERFNAAGVPCGPINGIDQVLADPQIVHRQLLRRLPHPTAGELPQVVSPLRFKNATLEFGRAPPLLNQHGAEILAEIGWTGPV